MKNADHFIFSDASFDPRTGRGVGAILLLSPEQWPFRIEEPFEIQLAKIDGENIARLEFLTAIWGLNEGKKRFPKTENLRLVIDCKAIENLLLRRERLEREDFQSKRRSERLANADLYRKFFILYDELRPQITWVKGHSPKTESTEIQRVFSLVDKAARKQLRK